MSFLNDYRESVGKIEAPEDYILFSSLIALSSLVGGKVWFNFGMFKILPNIYTVFIGPSGDGKTAAMSVTKRLLRELETVPIAASTQTVQSITREMAGFGEESLGFLQQKIDPKTKKPVFWTPLTICATELSNFLNTSSPEEMLDFLTTIYDEPTYEVKTKNKGNDFIRQPYLVFLGCTVPSWIYGYMKKGILTAGLARRCLWIYPKGERERYDWLTIEQSQLDAWDRLIKRSKQIQKIVGEIKLTDECYDWYKEWYHTREISKDDIVQAFSIRANIQAFKLATLISLSESDDLVIEMPHFQLAAELVKRVEKQMTDLFCGVGENPQNAQATRLIEKLSQAPKVQFNTFNKPVPAMLEINLRRVMFQIVRTEEYKTIIKHLQETDIIQRVKDPKTMNYFVALASSKDKVKPNHQKETVG